MTKTPIKAAANHPRRAQNPDGTFASTIVAPYSRPKRVFFRSLVVLSVDLVQLCGRHFYAAPAHPQAGLFRVHQSAYALASAQPVTRAKALPSDAVLSSRGHGSRDLGRLQQDRRLFSVDAALTEEQIGFLQELVDAGEVGRTISGLMSRAGLLRLVQRKYVTEQSTSLDTVLYRITDAGRDALRVLRWGRPN
jgi:hypothetical protein